MPGPALKPSFRHTQEAIQKEGLLYRLYNIDMDQAKGGREGWVLYPRSALPPRDLCSCTRAQLVAG